jgi:hypothetical protein
MRGAIPPLPHTSSWRCTWLSTETSLLFIFILSFFLPYLLPYFFAFNAFSDKHGHEHGSFVCNRILTVLVTQPAGSNTTIPKPTNGNRHEPVPPTPNIHSQPAPPRSILISPPRISSMSKVVSFQEASPLKFCMQFYPIRFACPAHLNFDFTGLTTLDTLWGEVKSLRLTEHHPMKTYWGSGGIARRILDFGIRWRWTISFTPWPLYPQGKSHWYPLGRRLGVPQSRSGRGGEEKNSQTPPGIES